MTQAEFRDALQRFSWERRVWRVDLHHSVKPSIDDYDGVATIEAIWRNDVERRGWEDIAQHVSIGPDGSLWTGRDWNRTPPSIGRHMNLGVFMIELIGNFDRGRDRLEGRQLDSTLLAIDAVQRQFGLPVQALLFRRDVPMAEVTSPGSGIEKGALLQRIRSLRSAPDGQRTH